MAAEESTFSRCHRDLGRAHGLPIGHLYNGFIDDLGASTGVGFGLWHQDQPMLDHRRGHGTNIIGCQEVSAFQQAFGFCSAKQR